MKIAFYDSSLTDEQWQILEQMLSKPRKTGRPPIARRKIIDAIFYIVKTGVQWRLLPSDFRMLENRLPRIFGSGSSITPGKL